MSDKLDFLDGEEPEPDVADVADQPEPQPQDLDKGDDGAPPAPAEDKIGYVPIQVVLAERDRVRENRERAEKAEREAEELRQWRAQIEAQQKAAPPPDMFSDPDKWAAHERQTIEQKLWNERLNMSEMLTRDKHGDDAVNAARDAFIAETQRNPALYMEMKASTNPYGFVLQWHKRQSVLSEIGTDPDAWKAKQMETIKEQLRAEIMAEVQGTVQPKPRIPGSLASAPAAGKAGEPRPRGSAYDAAFGG